MQAGTAGGLLLPENADEELKWLFVIVQYV
jgi:hypothetical protein